MRLSKPGQSDLEWQLTIDAGTDGITIDFFESEDEAKAAMSGVEDEATAAYVSRVLWQGNNPRKPRARMIRGGT